jgi:hypothetical protein
VAILPWIVKIGVLLKETEVHETRVNNAHHQNHWLQDKNDVGLYARLFTIHQENGGYFANT